jgi:putative pyruvate formate lyase activating enzyme
MWSTVKVSLPKYFAVLEGDGRAKFLSCESLPEKVAHAEEILSSCRLCERRCGVDRTSGERGFCRVLESRVSSEFLHYGEEPELVPSYTIFFSGCTFSCVFCQNWDISQNPAGGVYIKPETLASMINGVSARNVNWVGGEPTPNLPYILRVLTHVKKNIPQVWNSNMYLTEEAMTLLDGVMDVYLTDFKYGNDACALKYSNAPKYWEIITRNHLEARRQAEVLVRHLVLPGHVECCTKPVLAWIAGNLPNVRVNVMDQYRPEYEAREFPEIARKLDRNEYKEAIEYGKKLRLNLV